jgi:hypothetical protein
VQPPSAVSAGREAKEWEACLLHKKERQKEKY